MRQVLSALHLNLRSLILLLTILSVTCLFVFSLFFVNYTVKERLIDNSLALNAEYSSRIAAHTNYQFEEILKKFSNFNNSDQPVAAIIPIQKIIEEKKNNNRRRHKNKDGDNT